MKCNLTDKEHFNKIGPISDRARNPWFLLPWCSPLYRVSPVSPVRGVSPVPPVRRVRTIAPYSPSNLVSTANYVRSRIRRCRWMHVQSVALHSTIRRPGSTGRHRASSQRYSLYIKRQCNRSFQVCSLTALDAAIPSCATSVM